MSSVRDVWVGKGYGYIDESQSIHMIICFKCGLQNNLAYSKKCVCCYCGFNGKTLKLDIEEKK